MWLALVVVERIKRLRDAARMSSHTVLGVDWCRGGWVGVRLPERGRLVVLAARELDDLLACAVDATCVAVDMPIGLPDVEREADKLARKYVGLRWSSIFMTPPAAVLKAESYAEANVIASGLVGKKISRQAWALRDNIQRVELLASRDRRLIEVHPEVSFCAMRGSALEYSKHSWNGQALRRDLLMREGIVLPDKLTEAGHVPTADVLDAAAAVWTARRFASGTAESFPEGATRDQWEVIWR